jgi:3-deoxy-D-manno-octulosonic-acid transferase
MRFVYSVSIFAYQFLIFVASLFKEKAKRFRNGRINWQIELKRNIDSTKPLIWFHCASLGEFEQGKPVLERLRNQFPNHFILLTFFSPSGFEIKKNEPLANYVSYLPLDTPINAKQFIEITKPKIGIFVKYEFWYNLIAKAHQTGTKLFLVSGIFRPNQIFFKPYGTWFLNQLNLFACLMVQNEDSKQLLLNAKIEESKVSITGDTRFDRVSNLLKEQFNQPQLIKWIENKKVLIAGSTWPSDLALLKAVWQKMNRKEWIFIIAPHDVNHQTINQIKTQFEAFDFDDLLEGKSTQHSILVINRIGILSKLYSFAQIAYIGGGFDKGIHNTLEAAVYGNAVFFGPRFQKFEEAKSLIAFGGAKSIQTANDMLIIIEKSEDLKKMGENAARYVANNVGAVDQTCHKIFPYLAQE